jgi:hypothetical protein
MGQLGSYWGRFVHTADPNRPYAPNQQTLPIWLGQSATTPVDLYMDTNELFPDYVGRGKWCDFWDEVGYNNTFGYGF